MKSFSDTVRKIGINPYVSPPQAVLAALFEEAGRARSPIPVRSDAGIDVRAEARVRIEFDPEPRGVSMPPAVKEAMADNRRAEQAFERDSGLPEFPEGVRRHSPGALPDCSLISLTAGSQFIASQLVVRFGR